MVGKWADDSLRRGLRVGSKAKDSIEGSSDNPVSHIQDMVWDSELLRVEFEVSKTVRTLADPFELAEGHSRYRLPSIRQYM